MKVPVDAGRVPIEAMEVVRVPREAMRVPILRRWECCKYVGAISLYSIGRGRTRMRTSKSGCRP
jgi:hypothetical protein